MLHQKRRGRASSENSGFDGPGGWGPGRDQLNNNYYTQLLRNGRVSDDFALELQNNANNPPFPNQFLWREVGRRGGTFMFNADMALAVDMQGYANPVNGAVTCSLTAGSPTACPDSRLLPTAVQYASNNGLWVRDFRDALVKMVETGCGNGICDTIA